MIKKRPEASKFIMCFIFYIKKLHYSSVVVLWFLWTALRYPRVALSQVKRTGATILLTDYTEEFVYWCYYEHMEKALEQAMMLRARGCKDVLYGPTLCEWSHSRTVCCPCREAVAHRWSACSDLNKAFDTACGVWYYVVITIWALYICIQMQDSICIESAIMTDDAVVAFYRTKVVVIHCDVRHVDPYMPKVDSTVDDVRRSVE